MNDLEIDRVTLDLPGFSVEEARHMALDIIAGLAAGALPAAGDSPAVRVPAVRVEVQAGMHERGSELTARIVAEALRQLRREFG